MDVKSNASVKKVLKKKEKFLSKNLMQSIQKGEFFIYLQPKFNTITEQIVGAEALIRKRVGEEIILPNKFVPFYEQTGDITILDMFVLEEVCKLQKKWNENGYKKLPISINESRRHLKNPKHLEELQEILKKYDANPHFIELEMTETTVAENIEIAKKAEQNVHQLGFIISMDDFRKWILYLSYFKRY